MKKNKLYTFFLSASLKRLPLLLAFGIVANFSSCIGEDIINDLVDPVIRITKSVSGQLTIGSTYQYEAKYFDRAGMEVSNANIIWSSSEPDIVSISSSGLITALKAGRAVITATISVDGNMTILDQSIVEVINNVVVVEPTDPPPPDQGTTNPVLIITNPITMIVANTGYTFAVGYVDTEGMQTQPEGVVWMSSDNSLLSIENSGEATAHQAGEVTVTATYTDSQGNTLNAVLQFTVTAPVVVTDPKMFSGTIMTTSSYLLEGSFTLTETEQGLQLSIAEDYRASTALPGLYIYLSNNPNTVSGALEIGAVQIFQGAHTYSIANKTITDYRYILYWCKPFNVKVGEALIF